MQPSATATDRPVFGHARRWLYALDPVLPLSPGRAEKHGFEYYQHGTPSLYDGLDVKTGKVQEKTASRHTSAEFVSSLADVVKQNSAPREIHILLDKYRRIRFKR